MTTTEISNRVKKWKDLIFHRTIMSSGFIFKEWLPLRSFILCKEATVDWGGLASISDLSSPNLPVNDMATVTYRNSFKEIYIIDFEMVGSSSLSSYGIITYFTRDDVESNMYVGPYPGTIDLSRIPVTKLAVEEDYYQTSGKTIISTEELFFYKHELTS